MFFLMAKESVIRHGSNIEESTVFSEYHYNLLRPPPSPPRMNQYE
jgi:hypothetical protein